eukprot:3351328-Rhodomonas_salina.3
MQPLAWPATRNRGESARQSTSLGPASSMPSIRSTDMMDWNGGGGTWRSTTDLMGLGVGMGAVGHN